eukprot:TRINITY_DN6903_c0_g1_i2.p1 TRINITY_DN6903_c0_g1~~TRINITY_DN6903_c0_g1_i2.p1  ORF type:complete len:818 (+),score=225.05 TRINITY_DN6903_c0_g1_i2:630-3083(+)
MDTNCFEVLFRANTGEEDKVLTFIQDQIKEKHNEIESSKLKESIDENKENIFVDKYSPEYVKNLSLLVDDMLRHHERRLAVKNIDSNSDWFENYDPESKKIGLEEAKRIIHLLTQRMINERRNQQTLINQVSAINRVFQAELVELKQNLKQSFVKNDVEADTGKFLNEILQIESEKYTSKASRSFQRFAEETGDLHQQQQHTKPISPTNDSEEIENDSESEEDSEDIEFKYSKYSNREDFPRRRNIVDNNNESEEYPSRERDNQKTVEVKADDTLSDSNTSSKSSQPSPSSQEKRDDSPSNRSTWKSSVPRENHSRSPSPVKSRVMVSLGNTHQPAATVETKTVNMNPSKSGNTVSVSVNAENKQSLVASTSHPKILTASTSSSSPSSSNNTMVKSNSNNTIIIKSLSSSSTTLNSIKTEDDIHSVPPSRSTSSPTHSKKLLSNLNIPPTLSTPIITNKIVVQIPSSATVNTTAKIHSIETAQTERVPHRVNTFDFSSSSQSSPPSSPPLSTKKSSPILSIKNRKSDKKSPRKSTSSPSLSPISVKKKSVDLGTSELQSMTSVDTPSSTSARISIAKLNHNDIHINSTVNNPKTPQSTPTSPTQSPFSTPSPSPGSSPYLSSKGDTEIMSPPEQKKFLKSSVERNKSTSSGVTKVSIGSKSNQNTTISSSYSIHSTVSPYNNNTTNSSNKTLSSTSPNEPNTQADIKVKSPPVVNKNQLRAMFANAKGFQDFIEPDESPISNQTTPHTIDINKNQPKQVATQSPSQVHKFSLHTRKHSDDTNTFSKNSEKSKKLSGASSKRSTEKQTPDKNTKNNKE